MMSILFGAFLLFQVSNTANILGIFLTPSYSHQIVFQPIWKELSLRGHRVTVYTPNPLNDKSLINLTEFDLGFTYELVSEIQKAGNKHDAFIATYEAISERLLSHVYLRNLIKNSNNESYDLLLVEYLWPTMYAFKELYKVPMVGITSLSLTIIGADALGMEKHPILDPDFFLKFSYAETVIQRVLSWAYNWLYRLNLYFKVGPNICAQIHRHFGKTNKSVFDLVKGVDLVLGNYNLALMDSKPLVPKFVPISGIHIQPLKPLAADLANLLDSQKTDIIYFSFGTNVRVSKLSEEKINRVLGILGRLPYTILWKYDTSDLAQNLPKNFVVRKWFPQQDILGHPKVKLFITQGGLQSIDEALSRKVPMLLVPFLADQITNADRCVRLGIGESINFASFTDHEFETKISNLLTDSSYQKNINKQSLIASDQPLSSLETAIFWIEYVLRHEGAPHLKYKAVDLPFYQYYLLDVYLFVGIICTILCFIVKKVCLIANKAVRRHILSRLFGSINEKKDS